MRRYFKVVVLLLAIGLLWIFPTSVLADNPGIIKARLLQDGDRSYVLEADASAQLAPAIQPPIFPARFQVSALDYVTLSGGAVIIQASATTSGEPLSAEDSILLPWAMNGVAMTVQWIDGSVHQDLFIRTPEGIRVPIGRLRPSDKTLAEVIARQIEAGLGHLLIGGIHPALIGGLALLSPGRMLFGVLLYYALGQACSLVLVDFGMPGFDLLFVDILGTLLIFTLADAAIRKRSPAPYLPLLFGFGLLHGLAYAQELLRLDLPVEYRLPALFAFNLTIDGGHLAMAILAVSIATLWRKLRGQNPQWLFGSRYRPTLKSLTIYIVGAFSVASLTGLLHQYALTGKTDILNFGTAQNTPQFSLPASPNPPASGSRPVGIRQLITPVMAYMSVEPYEVRQEVLVQARAAVQFLGVNDAGMGSIPIESLDRVKQGILEQFQQANFISIDDQPVEPTLARADFVTLSSTGVTFRESPVPESLDDGILSLTLVYPTAEIANDIEVDWGMFSDTVQQVQTTVTDPFGTATLTLNPSENIWQWEQRLSGYRVPVIEEIEAERRSLPAISAILFVMALGLWLVAIRRPKFRPGKPVLLGVVGLGLVLYPFVRFPVDLLFVPQWKPADERAAVILNGLLTNVYRAFELREDSAVYDRLAISVMGDRLTETYLQNRRSLELENRGGARTKVDDVEILAVNSVSRVDPDGFTVDALWTVGGSVTHFGHTHYRRNQYRALVTVARSGDVWKIREIETLDERRVL